MKTGCTQSNKIKKEEFHNLEQKSPLLVILHLIHPEIIRSINILRNMTRHISMFQFKQLKPL